MAAAAIPAVQAGVKLLTSLTAGLLAAHTARLAAAKDENAALVNLVPAWDADVKVIVNAYNSRQSTASQCIAALQQLDAQTVAYLKQQVGKSGTAWNDSSGMAGKCDKTCTAGCCVYYGDLGPPVSLLQIAMGGSGGKWGASDSRLSSQPGGYVVTVPKVFGSKYGGITRESYTLQVLKLATSAANPAQFAQDDSPVYAPLGRVSNGTPTGQTPTFSAVSTGLLQNASILAGATPLQPGSSATPVWESSATGGGSKMLLVAGAVLAVVGIVAYAVSK